MSNYINRQIETNFDELCDVMRIVLISGARQCGKTTLMRHKLTSEDIFLTMDDNDTLMQAMSEPEAFIRYYTQRYKRIAIDEIQKAPQLLGQVKFYVDQHPQVGRFLLSGSANFRSLPTVNESMAGRLAEVRLRPMTQAEIAGKDNSFIDELISENYARDHFTVEECSKLTVLQKCLQGGYPELLNKSSRSRSIWYQAYLKAILERDLQDIGNFQKKDAIEKILHRIATVSSSTIIISDISSKLQEDRRLISRYLQALKTMYLIDEVPAWTQRHFDRLAKSSEWFVNDTGMMGAILGHSDAESLMQWALRNGKAGTDLIGKFIETFVYTQLVPLVEASGEWTIYYWRLQDRREIDFILEKRNGEKILIEVKASESVSSSDFDHIRWFKNQPSNDILASVVLYCGQQVRDFGDHCIAVPIANFWTKKD